MVARIARSVNFFYRILNISPQNLKDKSLTLKVKKKTFLLMKFLIRLLKI
jgi:hypothetical protein